MKISIYDGKEIHKYRNDTPCTYAVQFTIVNNKLNMCVVMRSNDLWYGFCNDQYQFSRLQIMIAERLNKLFLTKTAKEWEKLLLNVNVPVAIVNTIEEVINNSQFQYRGIWSKFNL